jgi:outer membrane protein insertion porin family
MILMLDRQRQWIISFVVGVLCFCQANAEMISKITVHGNRRVPESSIVAFSQLAVGLDVDESDIKESIKAIYRQGGFARVRVEMQGTVCVITVKERPVIKSIEIKKNKLLPEEGVNDILKKSNLESGEVLSPKKLKQFKYVIINEYRMNGYPDVAISEEIKEAGDGLVDITLTVVKEGQYQVRQVKINGNLAFSDKAIQKAMSMGTPSLYAYFFGGNYFSKQAFEKSKYDLNNYYTNRGFLKFVIEDEKITKVPGKKLIDIELTLQEGPRFMFSHIGVYGDNIVKKTQFSQVESLQKGINEGQQLPFSRDDVYKLSKKIQETLEKKGYAVKSITPDIKVNEKSATVDLRFSVERGVPTRVRKIEFKGNTLTMDQVLRREVAISEGEMYSGTAVTETIRRLSNLGYIKNVKSQVLPVPSTTKEVDLLFELEESPQAMANFEMGFNQKDYVVFSASLVHPNFGGTGHEVDTKIEKSRVRTTVSLKGAMPFVFKNGLGVSYKAYYNNQKQSKDSTTESKYTWQQAYSSEKVGFNINAQAPIGLYQNIALTAEVNKNNYNYDKKNNNIPDSVSKSINRYGNDLWNFILDGKWIRSTLDRAVLPSSGNREEVGFKLGAPLNESFTSYMTINSNWSMFKKIKKLPLIINPTARVGIGQGFRGFTNISGCLMGSNNDESCYTELPFDEKFYSSGTSPVRGVMTFGEKVNGKAVGGDLITTASLNMFLPTLQQDQVIPSLFIDGGYVYNQHDFDFNKWVYSAGVQVRVATPMAPVLLIFSYPLKIDTESSASGKDAFKYFQFSMQANLY